MRHCRKSNGFVQQKKCVYSTAEVGDDWKSWGMNWLLVLVAGLCIVSTVAAVSSSLWSCYKYALQYEALVIKLGTVCHVCSTAQYLQAFARSDWVFIISYLFACNTLLIIYFMFFSWLFFTYSNWFYLPFRKKWMHCNWS